MVSRWRTAAVVLGTVLAVTGALVMCGCDEDDGGNTTDSNDYVTSGLPNLSGGGYIAFRPLGGSLAGEEVKYRLTQTDSYGWNTRYAETRQYIVRAWRWSGFDSINDMSIPYSSAARHAGPFAGYSSRFSIPTAYTDGAESSSVLVGSALQ